MLHLRCLTEFWIRLCLIYLPQEMLYLWVLTKSITRDPKWSTFERSKRIFTNWPVNLFYLSAFKGIFQKIFSSSMNWIFCVILIYIDKTFYVRYDFKQIQNFKCLDFGKNDQVKPKNYNLPSCITIPQAVLKQIS